MEIIDFPEKTYKALISLEATPYMWNMAHFAPTAIEWANMEKEIQNYPGGKGVTFIIYIRHIIKWYVFKRCGNC